MNYTSLGCIYGGTLTTDYCWDFKNAWIRKPLNSVRDHCFCYTGKITKYVVGGEDYKTKMLRKPKKIVLQWKELAGWFRQMNWENPFKIIWECYWILIRLYLNMFWVLLPKIIKHCLRFDLSVNRLLFYLLWVSSFKISSSLKICWLIRRSRSSA